MATALQPYVGPRPFERTAADRNRFFGRDDEASDLLSCVIAHSAVLLYSQSGAGKTSLINAKLTPMLEKAGLEVIKPARVRDVPPEDSVFRRISNIYAFNVLRSWDEGVTDPKVLAETPLSKFLKDHKSTVAEGEDPKPRVAIFDQFEELFTSYQERSADREDFFDQVGEALEEDRLLRVVFAMREDYIAELDPYLPLLPEKLRTRYRIERLSEDDALLAVTEPLRDTEYSYADGVAEQLVENLLMVPVETVKGVEKVRGQSVEPVQLQVVCQTLWENCQNTWGKLSSEKKVITREYLEAFGDVDQALSTFYEKAISRVVLATGVKEGVVRRWFEQSLITSAGTRGTVFRGPKETGDLPNAAVDELVNQHIIRAELRGGSRWYELTHDRFIAPIKASNERWLLAHSGGEQTPKRLEARAEQWALDGRQRKDLFDEGELLEAKRWLESPSASDVGYSERLATLVEASGAAQAQQQVKSARRLRLLAAALMLLVILLIGASIVAFKSQREAEALTRAATDARVMAEDQKGIAEKQTKLAEDRKRVADDQRHLADARNVELQGLYAIVSDEKNRAKKQTLLAKTNERIARNAKADLEEYNKELDDLSTKFKEADDEYGELSARSPQDLKEQCDLKTALASPKAKYEHVFAGYVAFHKVAEQRAVKRLIEEIENRQSTLTCPH